MRGVIMRETGHSLNLENISWGVGGGVVVDALSLELKQGELVMILGPNGAGKSSLMRLASGLVKPQKGQVKLSGGALDSYSDSDRARLLGYLPQIRQLAWPNRVEDIVALGRYAHGGGMGMMGDTDRACVEQTLAACDLETLRHRAMTSLSGGEQTRVHCARLFAAQTPLVLADEPITALDPRHQHRIMQLFKDYVAAGNGALVVLHDLELAARYADRLIWMSKGRVYADGSVAETVSSDTIASVFGMESQIKFSGDSPKIYLTPVLGRDTQ